MGVGPAGRDLMALSRGPSQHGLLTFVHYSACLCGELSQPDLLYAAVNEVKQLLSLRRENVTVQKTTALGDNREGPAFDPDSICRAASSSAVFLPLPTCGKVKKR